MLLAEIPKAGLGSADCRKNWTTALIPRSSGFGTHPSCTDGAQAARVAWGGRYKTARGAMRELDRSKTGIASLPHVRLAPVSAPGHLDAVVSFAGAGQRRRLFQGLDIFTIEWAIGDLPEECRFLLNTQRMFFKKEKNPPRSYLTRRVDSVIDGSARNHRRRPGRGRHM